MVSWEDGVYAYTERPEDTIASPKSETEALSPLVRSRVKTSSGFAAIQVATVVRYDTKVPASFSTQVVWHSSKAPSFKCVCACRKRIPALSCEVTDSNWLSVGRTPTKAES